MTAIDIPGYVIRREVGVGGMASVYLALQTSLDREVALKIMSPALAADTATHTASHIRKKGSQRCALPLRRPSTATF